ncbi:MAG: hypothetical protein ABJF50_21360 [Paracoccaceae bacterium]
MQKGEIVLGSLSGLSCIAALDAYVGTGTSSWLADICFSGDAPPPMIDGMPPMEDHSKHAAYFASASLTFLAGALGWEYAETKLAKLAQTEPLETQRKRLLSCIIYVATAANKANQRVVDSTFQIITGFDLEQDEAKDAFDYLMREGAPDLHLILAGATKRERQNLLRAVVQTWATHGMDSEQATAVTERIVALLGFDQNDMCTALDRLWLKEQASSGLRTTYKISRTAALKAGRATVTGAKSTGQFLAPHARRITTRALTAIQR